MKIEQIAQICHEANKAYCESLGDTSQFSWIISPPWQQESSIAGVKFRLKNVHGTPQEQHENWLKQKRDEGWKYGIIKNPDKKEHPCFTNWDSLPELQKVKDVLFISIVDCLKEFLE